MFPNRYGEIRRFELINFALMRLEIVSYDTASSTVTEKLYQGMYEGDTSIATLGSHAPNILLPPTIEFTNQLTQCV